MHSFKLTYHFPSWFSNVALSSMVYNNHASGPQMSLTSPRIICRNSDIFCFAIQGDIAGIKDLFSMGLAFPFDATHNYGYTSLHYATDYGHYELCAFLMKAGAKGEIQDFDRRTASDISYHKLVCPPLMHRLPSMSRASLIRNHGWSRSNSRLYTRLFYGLQIPDVHPPLSCKSQQRRSIPQTQKAVHQSHGLLSTMTTTPSPFS